MWSFGLYLIINCLPLPVQGDILAYVYPFFRGSGLSVRDASSD